MVFSSILFMFIYLPVVLFLYYISPVRWRNPILFLANLVFYGWGEPVFIVLMLFSITINYINGMLIGRWKLEKQKRAKAVLAINVVINLALLGFFKYYDLIAETLSLIPFINIKPLGIALPIGISFYTFQTMSYPIDVYRGDADVQRNYISFGTFVALFPQLIAGPIVRYKDVADQLSFRASSIDQFSSGVERFMVGVAKKVLIANNLGKLWDYYAAIPNGELTFLGSWLGIIAFSLQIYFDFSGYSDMAIGLGRMIGFEFKENFDYPYISKSVTEFWRRWHMSLGTWFRDYLYIPLGGNRCGRAGQLFNILVVWAATGIWHGANWTFLMWGLYYAVFLMIEKLFLLKRLEKLPAVGHIYTVIVVIFGWVMFQLNTLGQIGAYMSAMLGFGASGFAVSDDLYYLVSYAATFVIAILAATPLGKTLFSRLPDKVRKFAAPALIVLALVFSTAYLVDATYNPFIYFNF
ncbi:MAG TPA: MBOAT family protein [Candidatus Scatomorpha pullistercoris]|uniref:MBOAT family protein n=1 Tax=Candidatus Scatomorpha pullistercoris TaxID=2840929 RepID=A0A9D1K9I2_9FIRM|nr:MBOAT family protein [Candidatus Scatomorpha pullistercoris]